MLPPGHVAAGYLTGYALLKITHSSLTPVQTRHLLYWSMFFGFIPDWDSFVTFAKEKSFTVRNPERNDHRNFWNHAPILWLAAGLLIYFLAQSTFWKYWGLLLWLGSWSHFLMDSWEHGIMWLWPFSAKRFALRDVELIKIGEPGFFSYWWEFLKIYTGRLTFYIEIIVILAALIIYFK